MSMQMYSFMREFIPKSVNLIFKITITLPLRGKDNVSSSVAQIPRMNDFSCFEGENATPHSPPCGC
jgi:hypothetical protein